MLFMEAFSQSTCLAESHDDPEQKDPVRDFRKVTTLRFCAGPRICSSKTQLNMQAMRLHFQTVGTAAGIRIGSFLVSTCLRYRLVAAYIQSFGSHNR
jgi:hypothetical protein